MEILLIRHGQAVEHSQGLGDEGRWLTGKGRKITRRVARWLARRDERRPVAVWTSPLVRAVQTAEIIAEGAGLTDDVSVAAELAPGHGPHEILRQLTLIGGGGPLALVGHEPSLSSLVVTLLGDAAFAGIKKSGVVAVSWIGQTPAALRFVLDPSQIA